MLRQLDIFHYNNSIWFLPEKIQLNLASSQHKGLGFFIQTIRSSDYKILWKSLREKEKLLVTSNVSFSLNVFLFIVSINFLPFYD